MKASCFHSRNHLHEKSHHHHHHHHQNHLSFSSVIFVSLVMLLLIHSSHAWFTFYSSQLVSSRNFKNLTASNTSTEKVFNRTLRSDVRNRTRRDTEAEGTTDVDSTTPETLPTPLPSLEVLDADVVKDEVAPLEQTAVNSTPNGTFIIPPLPCPWFTCRNGRCVVDVWRCDLQDDCGDGSDEDGCDQLTECPPTLNGAKPAFRCKSGMCISASWICDSFKDCPHGDDEDNC